MNDDVDAIVTRAFDDPSTAGEGLNQLEQMADAAESAGDENKLDAIRDAGEVLSRLASSARFLGG